MRWLIKSLIVRHGTTILYGQPKIGKKLPFSTVRYTGRFKNLWR